MRPPRQFSRSAFTLIELLVVIAIVAILAVVVVLVLNPAEQLKQSRDSQRLAELATLNKAISLYQADLSASTLGTASTVYVSIPSNTSNCSNLGLPSLPSGWFYACAPSSTYRNVDSTGWIPVDFTAISFKSPLGQLPIDPINTTSTQNYYTYIPGGVGRYELAAGLESSRYKMGGGGDKASKDGGAYSELYETGSSPSLLPLNYGDTALVGYWKFDEGSGTTAYDASGKGNNGTLGGTPVWINDSTCMKGSCLQFPDASYVLIPAPATSTLNIASNLTIVVWMKLTTLNPTGVGIHPIKKYSGTPNANYVLYYCGSACGSNSIYRWYANVGGVWGQMGSYTPVAAAGDWNQYAVSFSTQGQTYWNGAALNYITSLSGTLATNTVDVYIGNDTAGSNVLVMDEVRIYNRALSAAEIQAVYSAVR